MGTTEQNSAVRLDDVLREMEAVLLRRVDQVERENARLRRLATIFGAGLAVALLLPIALVFGRGGGDEVADVLQARSFVLRDENGVARGALEMARDGGVVLTLRDSDARDRARLSLLADGSPGLTFADREGRTRAVLGVLPDQTSTLVFADQSGRSRAVLGVTQDQSSTLVFADRFGETRVGVGVDGDGTPNVTLFEHEAPAVSAPVPADSTATDSAAGAGATGRP
jgi:hypothetical protein